MDDPEVDYESLFNDALDELEFALMADGLPLNSNVNDAEFADTQRGMQIPEETDCLNFPDIHPQLFNFTIPLPIPEPDYIDNSLHPTWHQIDMMPTLTEDSPSATLNSSSVSEQSPGFSPAYSTSPLSTNYSPREQLLPPSLGPTPTPTHDSSPKKKRQQRRQAKAERGNRPCDKRRADRKNNKKVQCVFCPKKVQDDRDLKRHYRAKHREEAAEMGIDMRRFPCKYCSGDFARDDHLKRHMGTQHGIE